MLPIDQALGLISGNVARVLGLDGHKGRLAVGFDADVTLLDPTLTPQRTYVAGRCVYSCDLDAKGAPT